MKIIPHLLFTLTLLASSFANVQLHASRYIDEEFSTTVGAVRKAFMEKGELINHSSASPMHYKVFELVDCLASVSDSTPIQFYYPLSVRGITEHLYARIEHPPVVIYDPENPTKIIDMQGGESGIFLAKIQRIANSESPSCQVNPQQVSQPIEPSEENILKIKRLPSTEALHSSDKTQMPTSSYVETTKAVSRTESFPNNISEQKTSPQITVLCKGAPDLPSKDFYAYHDEKSGNYVYLERLNEKNLSFWRQRFGNEAYVLLNEHLNELRNNQMEPIFKRDLANSFLNERLVNDVGPFDDVLNQYHHNKVDTWDYHAMELGPRSIPTPKNLVGYLSAMHGFYYNMKHYKEAPTLIAYVSSKSFDTPLYLSGESVISKAIGMMMTVRFDEDFYSPLGILKSCISPTDFNSIRFHSDVAGLMNIVNPNAKRVMVRPLEIMETLFIKSKIPLECLYTSKNMLHSSKRDIKASPSKPTVTYAGGYDNIRYTLHDPLINTSYQISRDHWFSMNPYSGDLESDNPLITMHRDDLENYNK